MANAMMNSSTRNVVKALQREKESLEKEQKVYGGRLDDQRKKVNELLDQAIKKVYGALGEEVDKPEELRLGVQILQSLLNPRKVVGMKPRVMMVVPSLREMTRDFIFIICIWSYALTFMSNLYKHIYLSIYLLFD